MTARDRNYAANDLMVQTRDLAKSFTSRHLRQPLCAVDALSIEVQRGETFGLIGADGAGKTTTLRLLNGLLRPDGGSAQVAGFDTVRDFREIHGRAGYMPQQFALYRDLTVAENLEFFAELHGLTVAQKTGRIPRLLGFARLESFGGRLAAHLSGGMKKKLALACMLVHEPEVVFLDEPTLGVDPVSRREFWSLLADLRVEKGLTIVVCTPYMDEAERCHRVALMHQGRLIACAPPESLKRNVPGELLELQPSQVFAAQDLVANLDGVHEVQTYGSLLHVFVDRAEVRSAQVRAALEAQGVIVSGLRVIEPRMEDAFVSLIRRQSGTPGARP